MLCYFESKANNAVALIVHIHRWKVKCRPINLTLKANFFHAKFISPKQREFSIHSAGSPTYILAMYLLEKIMNASSLASLTCLTLMVHTSFLPSNWNLDKIFALTGELGPVHKAKKL